MNKLLRFRGAVMYCCLALGLCFRCNKRSCRISSKLSKSKRRDEKHKTNTSDVSRCRGRHELLFAQKMEENRPMPAGSRKNSRNLLQNLTVKLDNNAF